MDDERIAGPDLQAGEPAALRHLAAAAGGIGRPGVAAALRRWVADDTWVKRLLTARRWMSRAYFEARYFIPDPWRLATSLYEHRRFQASMDMLAGRRYGRALEVGCGEGIFTALLLDRCDHVVALDFSRLAVRRARRRLAGNPGVEVRSLDVRVADPGGAFDLVFCAELFYYMSRREFEDVAARMVRWVAPGGDLCLVHGTSVHDAGPRADGTGAIGEMSARVIHDRFCRVPGLSVIHDRRLPRYRLTLLRRLEAPRG